MAEWVLMPQKGLTEESAILSIWHVQVGDQVKAGDYLFDIETGKAVFSIESPVAGVVLATLGEEGDEVPVMQPVCAVGEAGEQVELPDGAAAPAAEPAQEEKKPEVKAPAPAEAPAPAAAATPVAAPATATAPPATAQAARESAGGRIAASPLARRLAGELGVDLSQVTATGAEGRIVKADVLRASEAQPAAAAPAAAPVSAEALASLQFAAGEAKEPTVVRNSTIRKVIANNMHQSLSEMAQLTLHGAFDATQLIKIKDDLKAAGVEPRITINDLILYAVSRTLLAHPALNAHFSLDQTTFFHQVNLGVAVDTPNGLLVPTIFNADRLSLAEIARQSKILAAACQQGQATPEMMSGGTFTVTNMGTQRVNFFTPVIAPPQTGILGVGTISYARKPGADGAMVDYPQMGLSLTFDHRALDGWPASQFLTDLCNALENYVLLLAKG